MLYGIGQLIVFESCYHSSRERKGTDHSGGGRTFDIFIGHVEEPLESAFPSIINSYANFRGGKVGVDG